MAEPEKLESPREKAPRREGWRWRTRFAVAALTLGLLVTTVLGAIVVRPDLLVIPANWLLRDQPIRITCERAELYAPRGWQRPRFWAWRIDGFALLSKKDGLPTLMADAIIFRMPEWRKSWQMGAIVIPKAGARHFTVFIPESHPPPPFEEFDAWPIGAVAIDQAVLFDFELVMRDPTGLLIIMEDVDGQVLNFQYNIGHREMYGHGDSSNGMLQVGPFAANNLRAIPIDFNGRSLIAQGEGTVQHQRAHVVFAIDGLFRPKAKVHAAFSVDRAKVRPLLHEALGDDAPDMDGFLTAAATVDTDPPEVVVDVTFLLEEATVLLPEDTKKILLTALKIIPYVELKDHLVRLGPLSGHVGVDEGVITLVDGRYIADKTTARVDGKMARDYLNARVHFVPEPGTEAMEFGLLLTGTAKHPKVALVDTKVLEAWSIDEQQTAKEIRAGIKDTQAERRAMRRGERKRRGAKGDEAEAASAEPVPPGEAPPLTGPVEELK